MALGGYGRGEQCLYSDVDVMILHRGVDPEPLVRLVLYPLWDANLKVGHAVRTVKECRTAARERLDTLTTLLSARLVAGDTGAFAQLEAAIAQVVRGRPLAPRLAHEERQRRLADPYPVMAADVKEGRGGLRTFQGLWWERRRCELLGLPVHAADDHERSAVAALLAARNALHASAGRAVDEFVVDLREPAARWLGTDVRSLAASVTAALDRGDRLADRHWPDLHVEQDQLVGLGRRVFTSIRSRFSPTPGARPTDSSGVLDIAVRAAGRVDGPHLDAGEAAAIRDAPAAAWTANDRESFLRLLAAGGRGRVVFGMLEELGWIDRELPEWIPVAAAPQLAPFHDHPVGAHLWRTVDEMLEMLEEPGEEAAIADELGSTEDLILAAFLHDIGKARGGDHALVGAQLASQILRRTGFGPATSAVVVDAVRLHLLLSQTATRRDFADPAVIDEVAAAVGDVRQLQVLYLLTIADLRATGRTMWTPWRASLLRSLFVAVAAALETGGAAAAIPDVDAIVAAADQSLDRRAIEEHIAAMPADYLETATPDEVAWHISVAGALTGPARVALDPADPSRVLVVGLDRSGFLLAAARAFTSNGVGVVDARLRTRSDGVAIDTFHVRNDRGRHESQLPWERIEHDLIAALEGTRDLRPAIRERVRAYRNGAVAATPPQVRTGTTRRDTVIEIRAPDRIGLLTDIVEALHGEGLDVRFARIDTMGGEARDVFHVRRSGVPITISPELDALRKRIEDRLGE